MPESAAKEEDIEVFHYAACKDCELYKWVDSQSEAEIAAEKHHYQRGHEAIWGEIPETVIEERMSATEEEYHA